MLKQFSRQFKAIRIAAGQQVNTALISGFCPSSHFIALAPSTPVPNVSSVLGSGTGTAIENMEERVGFESANRLQTKD